MTCIKEILLSEVTGESAQLPGNLRVVVNYQSDPGLVCNGQDGLCKTKNLFGRGILGAELNQVGATIAKLTCNLLGFATTQVGSIDKRVKGAVPDTFHNKFG